MVLTDLKSRWQHGCVPSGGCGENSFPYLFWLLEVACVPRCVSPSSVFRTRWPSLLLGVTLTFTPSSALLVHLQGPRWPRRAHVSNAGQSSYFKVDWLAACESRTCESVTLCDRKELSNGSKVSGGWGVDIFGRWLFCLPQAPQPTLLMVWEHQFESRLRGSIWNWWWRTQSLTLEGLGFLAFINYYLCEFRQTLSFLCLVPWTINWTW